MGARHGGRGTAPALSCIIPCYNEGDRVVNVIHTALTTEMVNEVIVVDDGSTDESKAVLAKESGIHLISYAANRGKSYAVMTGLKRATHDLILVLDADLVGLTPRDLDLLIQPIVSGDADMTLTIKESSLLLYRLFNLDWLSGERAFNRTIIDDANQLSRLLGFGLEVYLNSLAIRQRLRLKVVEWPHVVGVRKTVKRGRWKGFWGDRFMDCQVLISTRLVGGPIQFAKMKQLCLK